ncbi:MAG: T9SS type A sorting domain-containing protein [Rubricoccaceae bacterium]|nr:T9SS type A sorting domain-containing protein [Rubricoccaceae bacterium]
MPLRYALVLTAVLALGTVAPAAAQEAREGAAAAYVGPEQMPNGYLLEPVQPNPFSTTATVGFAVTRAQRVDLALYDALGRRVRTLYSGSLEPNARVETQINGRTLPSGLYLVRLSGTGFSTTRRVTLLR